MSNAKILIFGLVFEVSALVALFVRMPVWRQGLAFLAAHVIASVLFSLLLTSIFPKRFKPKKSGLMMLFFSFAFFVPLFGAVAILITLVYFRKFQYLGERDEFFSVPLPPFLQEAAVMAAGMGEGGAWSRLRTTTLHRDERLKALMAVGGGSGYNTSSFLQLATSDSDDEIRLLAFNLCERHEQKINQAITTAMEGLKNGAGNVERAAFCRTLAFSYWELVYNSLSQDELRTFFVEQSLKYVHQTRELVGDDSSLMILRGKIHLLRREHEKAGEAIRDALKNGAALSIVTPYLAELAFFKRDFASVKRLLAQDPTLRLKPGIGPVAQFWRI
ncbi:MAG: hypothetical protein GJV46_02995 [Geobacter sp.]|nr:hypothetical protein [Geobacter sp.]